MARATQKTAGRKTAKKKVAPPQKAAARRPAARKKAKASHPAPQDAISLLKADHRKVESLFSRLSSAQDAKRREQLLDQIKQELEVHTAIEEDIFYPAFKEAAAKKEDRRMFHEAVEEHHAVDVVLPDVQRADPASESFAGRAKVLKEIVEHHVEEEESEMFPRARKLLSTQELRELGARMKEQKKNGRGAFRTVASFVGLSR